MINTISIDHLDINTLNALTAQQAVALLRSACNTSLINEMVADIKPDNMDKKNIHVYCFARAVGIKKAKPNTIGTRSMILVEIALRGISSSLYFYLDGDNHGVNSCAYRIGDDYGRAILQLYRKGFDVTENSNIPC